MLTLAAPAAGIASSTTSAPATATATTAAAKQVQVPLTGWLGNGTTFPNRALVLSAPVAGSLTAARLSITENGAPVSSFTLTPTSQSRAGDFGVMLVVGQSPSMTGAPLAAAMAGVRAFAAHRAAAQELGLITFDNRADVILALTSDQSRIDPILNTTPRVGNGANVPAAAALALSQLAQSKVALGAIILISDGVGTSATGTSPSPASVQTAAAAEHVPIFTVGLQDRSATTASLQSLGATSPGQFVSSTPANLSTVLGEISATIGRGYVVRYRSKQPAGHQVAVTARAAGMPGTVEVGYQAPAAPAVSHAAAPIQRSAPVPAQQQSASRFVLAPKLSPWPSFAPQGTASAPAAQSAPFWGSVQSIPLVSGIAGVLIVLAIALALRRPKRAVRTRVGSFVPGLGAGTELVSAQAQPREKDTPRMLARANWWPAFVEDVEIARSRHQPVDLVKRAAVAGVVVGVLVGLLSGTPALGLLPMLLWPIPLRMAMKRAARKQRALFIDSLPGYLQDMASALRVGRSFGAALAIVADSADEPAHGELERAVTDEALGRSLEESLVAVGKRMQAPDVDQVALIAGLNRRSGSNVAEALDRVADGARDRADMRREIKALTAQGKMSSSVLTALPPLLLLAMSFVSPQYAYPLFHSTLGIVLLVVGGLMVFAGWKVMQKITTVKA